MLHVIGSQFRSNLVQCRPDSSYLSEDIHTVFTLPNHPAQTTDLTLDPGQSTINLGAIIHLKNYTP